MVDNGKKLYLDDTKLLKSDGPQISCYDPTTLADEGEQFPKDFKPLADDGKQFPKDFKPLADDGEQFPKDFKAIDRWWWTTAGRGL